MYLIINLEYVQLTYQNKTAGQLLLLFSPSGQNLGGGGFGQNNNAWSNQQWGNQQPQQNQWGNQPQQNQWGNQGGIGGQGGNWGQQQQQQPVIYGNNNGWGSFQPGSQSYQPNSGWNPQMNQYMQGAVGMMGNQSTNNNQIQYPSLDQPQINPNDPASQLLTGLFGGNKAQNQGNYQQGQQNGSYPTYQLVNGMTGMMQNQQGSNNNLYQTNPYQTNPYQ